MKMRPEPAFEIVCLGAGGGPLEGDVLGYMCKPYARRWDEGWLGLEGGCGIGALTALLHQAILTKALRRLHEASNNPSPASLSHHAFAHHPTSSSREPIDTEPILSSAPPSPPISTVPLNRKNIEESINSKPPQVLSKLGIAGKEQVHVEEGILFPGVEWPEGYSTPVLKAAWLFSHLTSYLITHAHFDHTLSLVLATGSLPNPPDLAPIHSLVDKTCPSSDLARRPVYASLSSLHKISKIYQGDVWPELGCWAESFPHDQRRPSAKRDLILTETGLVDSKAMSSSSSPPDGVGPGLVDHSEAMNHQQPLGMRMASSQNTMSNIKEKDRAQRRRSFRDTNLAQEIPENMDIAPTNGQTEPISIAGSSHVHRMKMQPAYELKPGVGVQYCPTPPFPILQRIPLRPAVSRDSRKDLIMTVQELPVSHGTTTQGNYESSAFFIRISQEPSAAEAGPVAIPEAEILFFGDIESSQTGQVARELNRRVWQVAAGKWTTGTLRAIFIECSYVGSRPSHLMFGHLSPPSLFAELELMASFLPRGEDPPLAGLRVFIQHVKEPLIPEEPIKQKIGRELEDLEKEHPLGVQFVCLARGMRISI
ncbi:hypothetical protein NliqN6_4244 [Naganishia liquefaciens]|uniref:Uncharacterized protein n=1 Tax=Naganishia liquefaciens TaxID=104408 RepID=A0A8H3TVD2_9TREE|nr:hypothetical protein NliqN6_4244 [Naganishia liquefaciens]